MSVQMYGSAVTAKFGVPLDLGGRQYLDGEQVVLEMCPPQRCVRGADCTVETAKLAGVIVLLANCLSRSASCTISCSPSGIASAFMAVMSSCIFARCWSDRSSESANSSTCIGPGYPLTSAARAKLMPRPARKSAICCCDSALIDRASKPAYGCCTCAGEGA